MKGIEPSSAIILKTRVLGELQPQVSKTGFAFVENRPTKKRVTFDIQCDVRQAFCCIEEIVRLETRGRCEAVKWIFFCHGDDVVRNRIDSKFLQEEVMHNERIAKYGKIGDTGYAVGKVRPIFKAEPIS